MLIQEYHPQRSKQTTNRVKHDIPYSTLLLRVSGGCMSLIIVHNDLIKKKIINFSENNVVLVMIVDPYYALTTYISFIFAILADKQTYD